jgi:hypothetical protein
VTIKGYEGVALITEVSCNGCQYGFKDQISYSVTWITGKENKVSWFNHDEITVHSNIFMVIAEKSCHAFGTNESKVKKVLGNLNRGE